MVAISAKPIPDEVVRALGEAYLQGRDMSHTREGRALADAAARRVVREFTQLQKKIEVIFTERDPYDTFAALRDDVVNNRRMYVYTGESVTPLWDPETNWKARAVHDYEHVEDLVGFDLQGELAAARASTRKAPELAPLVLSEVALQAASYHVLGGFPEGSQKLVFVNDALAKVANTLGARLNPPKRDEGGVEGALDSVYQAQVLGRFFDTPEGVVVALSADPDKSVAEGTLGLLATFKRK